MSDAASHFSTEAGGEPAGPGRYVRVDDIKPAEFIPGLEFRPVLGDKGMANFVHFEPGTEAPRHVHEEEQIVVVLEGEFTFDIDGQTRMMRKGDVAVVPSWVPHGAWTTDSSCLEVDFFSPPRTTLVTLANQQLGAAPDASAPDAPAPGAAPTPGAEA
jgi:quercetin dioxygenase-like cupin family protein